MEKWLVLMRILWLKSCANVAESCPKPKPKIQHCMIHMGQMILSEPSIIIVWMYQDMMEWMSRILDGEMAGADEYIGSKVGQMWLNFAPSRNHKSNSA
jgi:hypothetical protein